MVEPENVNFGWIKQEPDSRDFTIKPALMFSAEQLPASVDLRSGCPLIVDQGNLGSCTACAGQGMVDFTLKKEGHPFLVGSRLFLYYNTRVKIEHSPAKKDTGCTIRGTLKSLATYGICKESTWPYVIANFSKAPTAKMLTEGAQYQALAYASLDPVGSSPSQILTNVKSMLASGWPCDFGFDVYPSYKTVGSNGLWPYPKATEIQAGGHSVVAVGYDDSVTCPNATKGAFLCRNSWGTSFGLNGYFYLPYDYVIKPFQGVALASDWWTLAKEEYMNKGVV